MTGRLVQYGRHRQRRSYARISEVLELPNVGDLLARAEKVASPNTSQSATYVSSTYLQTESYPMWIVDSGSTDHVSRG